MEYTINVFSTLCCCNNMGIVRNGKLFCGYPIRMKLESIWTEHPLNRNRISSSSSSSSKLQSITDICCWLKRKYFRYNLYDIILESCFLLTKLMQFPIGHCTSTHTHTCAYSHTPVHALIHTTRPYCVVNPWSARFWSFGIDHWGVPSHQILKQKLTLSSYTVPARPFSMNRGW